MSYEPPYLFHHLTRRSKSDHWAGFYVMAQIAWLLMLCSDVYTTSRYDYFRSVRISGFVELLMENTRVYSLSVFSKRYIISVIDEMTSVCHWLRPKEKHSFVELIRT